MEEVPMRRKVQKPMLCWLVVGPCLFFLLLGNGTPSCSAIQILDAFSQNFQTIGARYRVVPNLISPDCTYVIPYRYNFGQYDPDQHLRLNLFGPSRTNYWQVNIPATYWYGSGEVAVDVPPYVPIGTGAGWGIAGYDYLHQIQAKFQQSTDLVVVVQPVLNFGLILPGLGFNDGWNGTLDGIGCTQDQVEDCSLNQVYNAVQKFFHWLLGQSGTVWSQATTWQVGGIGNQVQKKLAGRFRAYKVYKGLEVGNGKMGHYHESGVGAKERTVMTSGMGYSLPNIMDGYTVNGIQKVSMHPPGWGTEQGSAAGLGNLELDPVMAQMGYQVVEAGGNRYAVLMPGRDWHNDWGAYSSSSSSDTGDYADDDPNSSGANKRIDIDFSVTYNDNANTLTVNYGVSGTASWPCFGACTVSISGGSSGSATFNANGDAIEMEFALVQAGVSFQCPNPEGHPCYHGEVEANIGVIMDITYPTPDSVLFVFTLKVCAGAHAEIWGCPAGNTFYTCPCWQHELGRWGYDCSGDADIQDWVDANSATLNIPSGYTTYSQKIGYICANY
jgi:hypothetical protein